MKIAIITAQHQPPRRLGYGWRVLLLELLPGGGLIEQGAPDAKADVLLERCPLNKQASRASAMRKISTDRRLDRHINDLYITNIAYICQCVNRYPPYFPAPMWRPR